MEIELKHNDIIKTEPLAKFLVYPVFKDNKLDRVCIEPENSKDRKYFVKCTTQDSLEFFKFYKNSKNIEVPISWNNYGFGGETISKIPQTFPLVIPKECNTVRVELLGIMVRLGFEVDNDTKL